MFLFFSLISFTRVARRASPPARLHPHPSICFCVTVIKNQKVFFRFASLDGVDNNKKNQQKKKKTLLTIISCSG
jgi:hypothetical protein